MQTSFLNAPFSTFFVNAEHYGQAFSAKECSQVEVSSLLILSHLEELSDGDPVEGVGLLAAKHLEEHVLHIGEVSRLGRPAGPANGAN